MVKRFIRQGAGKVRRFVNGKLRSETVKKKLARRRGECVRCGTCCKLLFQCPFLEEHDDGSSTCRIHQKRPENCRIFPLDEKCLLDRDTLMPDTPCGYHFVDDDDGDSPED